MVLVPQCSKPFKLDEDSQGWKYLAFGGGGGAALVKLGFPSFMLAS